MYYTVELVSLVDGELKANSSAQTRPDGDFRPVVDSLSRTINKSLPPR